MERGLHDEVAYDAERRERRSAGLSRRRLLQVSGAWLAALSVGSGAAAQAADGPIVKPTPDDLFILRGTNAEMRWEAMRGQGYVTPIDRFFVRNHTGTPRVNLSSWRLRVHGSGVRRELSVSYRDLLRLPSVTLTRFVECAGNGRSLFDTRQGQAAVGTAWGLGAVGVARWTGVRLSSVLEQADLSPRALDVMPVGLDSMAVGRPMPLEKALADDTLLVYGMNGEALRADHGFPVRVLLPGWVGVSNVKWVGSIEVSEEPLYSRWNTTSYRMFGPAYPDTPLLTTQVVKSALELPFAATLSPGRQLLSGRSWSAYGRIACVDVSFDGGQGKRVDLDARNKPAAWRQWSVPWFATPGNHTVRIRATDHRGHVQPDTVPYNDQGYLFGAVVSHPATVG